MEALGEVPELEGPIRGWFALNFSQPDHVKWVLDRNWSFDQNPVLLKPWIPSFDASRERVDLMPIWVRLPGLPLPFSCEEHFAHIGNMLGSFLEADTSYKVSKSKRVARILVNINIKNGLPGALRMDWRQDSYH